MKLHGAVPIFRIFDVALARKFYVEWLGFGEDWLHQTNAPSGLRYLQVSRDNFVLHLSEHHGDCTPGSKVRVTVDDARAYHTELRARPNPFMNPGLKTAPWNALEIEVTDPFGNRLCFSQPL